MSLRADCLLATTGIFPDAITPREHVAAAGVPEHWARRLSSWIGREEAAPFDYRPPPDMDRMWTKLAKRPSQDEVAAWLDGIGLDDLELVADYYPSLERARDYVVNAWPQITIPSLAGPKLLPLSYDDTEEIWSVIQVLDDPDRVLTEIAAGTLTDSQAVAFRACYPDLAAHADESIKRAMIDRLARDMAWEPGREQEAMMNLVAGLPPEEPVRMPPPPPPAPPPKVESKADRERTQAEISSAPKTA